ncbi:MAG: fumarylacetoacetate hydrolase family protein [Anaerolineales bacterium]|nr:fumarylacetoacetate hydrolase family protein [Anaerolineales bacterium]
MRLVTFALDGRERIGAQVERSGKPCVLDLNQSHSVLPAEMNAFLTAGEPAMLMARRALQEAKENAFLPEADIRLTAPVPHPGKILCLGHNYDDHIGKDRTRPSEFPTFFCKTANTVIGPGAPIVIPPETAKADFEGELAVVIGRRARRIAEGDAPSYVAGYTIFNDVSARDYQKRTSQWMIGKSFDTFGPMGPALITADEIPDPHALDLALTLNGVLRQKTNTGRMIFTVPFLIATLSAVMMLEPGDVIATGTPARTPPEPGSPEFMQPGDLVRITVEKIGVLENPVVAETIPGSGSPA